ncbi:hypothetical protein HPB47_028025 [Ixodes persulcatus]|uniref:Uncharacterized protein n=1 Tax=Ixodes persulcatus TaxID=34615 RepID=A0AC60PUJ4_IXOPE|nr:hypothetical protein HPB47_028025 [Ixodes persulcatus]
MTSGCSTTSNTDRQNIKLKSYADLLGQCSLSCSSSGGGSSSSSSSSSSDDSSSQDSDSETLDVVGREGDPQQASLVSTTTLGSGDGVDDVVSAGRSEGNNYSSSEADDSENETRTAHVTRSAVMVPQVTLANKGEFLSNMEVQISPQGRLMQPVPTVRFANLLDDLQYAVWISFVQECGQIAGNYMHPDAPLPGSHWNQRLVSFSRLKLFTFDGFNRTPVGQCCFNLALPF